MKKLISLAIVIAMVAALAMVGVHAVDGHYVWNHTGDPNTADPFGETTMIGYQSPLDATIKFKTDVSFSKIFFPSVWAAPHAVITFEMLKGEEVVATTTFEFYNESVGSGDVTDVEIDLGKTLSAGEYTLRLSTSDAGQYAFFCYGEGQLSDEYIEYERGHAYFGLYTTDSGEGFVTFATEVSGGGSSTPAQGAKTVKIELTSDATAGVEVEEKDGKLICTTGVTNDPWVSIPVDIDTSVYKFFTVTYRCDKEIASNNTYMKTANYIGAADGGDWEPHGMKDTADGELHSVTYNIPEGFPTFADTTITGIRLTCCAEEGGVFTVESIVFSDVENPGEQGEEPSNPTTADAAVIAIAAVACIALAGVVVAKKVR